MMSLKTLIDYFDKNGWPVGVNEEKLNDRYSISDELYKVGWEVIEIERHRAIMGTTYHKGMPMNAYQTFWMRYAVQAKSEEVEELPERSGKINIYNMDLLVHERLSDNFSFSLTPIKSGKYLFEEAMFNIHKELSSLEEAVEFAEKMAEEEAEGFEEITDMEFSLSPEQLKQLRDEFLDRAKSYIVSIIKDLWITRNDEIE